MKSYTTLAGAARNRGNGSIIRILCDRDQIYVVVPSWMSTTIMSISPDRQCDGSITLVELTTRGGR